MWTEKNVNKFFVMTIKETLVSQIWGMFDVE